MNDVLAKIRKARFVVADLTYYNPNVYFEAGFAMGRSIPLICTVKKDQKKKEEKIGKEKKGKDKDQPFDLAQYTQIRWDENKWEDLSRRLARRIEALVGHGPESDKEPNPS